MELPISAIALLVGTSIAAYFIKGLVGFGPALITIPVLTWLIGFKEAVIIGTLSDIVSGIIILALDHRKINFKIVSIVQFGMLIGTAIGVSLLTILPIEILKKLFGVIIIVIVVAGFFNRNDHTHVKFDKKKGFLVGILAGIVGGLINTNGPVLVMYLKRVIKDTRSLRTNLATILLTDAVWRGILMIQSGLLDVEPLKLFTFVMFPGILIGILISQRMIQHSNNKYLKRLTEVLLIAFGSGLLFK